MTVAFRLYARSECGLYAVYRNVYRHWHTDRAMKWMCPWNGKQLNEFAVMLTTVNNSDEEAYASQRTSMLCTREWIARWDRRLSSVFEYSCLSYGTMMTVWWMRPPSLFDVSYYFLLLHSCVFLTNCFLYLLLSWGVRRRRGSCSMD